MTSQFRCAKHSASCFAVCQTCWKVQALFILYVHEHDRLGFGMLTVETAVLNPRAVVLVATEKVSSIWSNIIWNQWNSTLKERSVRVNL